MFYLINQEASIVQWLRTCSSVFNSHHVLCINNKFFFRLLKTQGMKFNSDGKIVFGRNVA